MPWCSTTNFSAEKRTVPKHSLEGSVVKIERCTLPKRCLRCPDVHGAPVSPTHVDCGTEQLLKLEVWFVVPCAVLLAILSQNILYHNVSLAPLFQHPRAFSPATTMSFILRYDTGPERLNTSACWQALLRHLCQDSRIGSVLGTSSLPQHITTLIHTLKSISKQKLMTSYLPLTYVFMWRTMVVPKLPFTGNPCPTQINTWTLHLIIILWYINDLYVVRTLTNRAKLYVTTLDDEAEHECH